MSTIRSTWTRPTTGRPPSAVNTAGRRGWTAWISRTGITSPPTSAADALIFGPAAAPQRSVRADLLRLLHQHLGLADGGVVDEAAVERDGALARFRGFGHGLEDALGLRHLGLAGREHLVGERHLRGVDGPFAFAAQHGAAAAGGAVAVGVREVPERAVDGAQAVGARGHHHSRDGVVPHVAPVGVALVGGVGVGEDGVVRIGAADAGGAGARRGGVVGDAEMEGLVAFAGGGDLGHVLHAERGLDDQLEADALLARLRGFYLCDQHIQGVDVGGGADLRDHDEVEAVAGLLQYVHDVAVHVVGVEAVDADGERLGTPVDVVDGGDD